MRIRIQIQGAKTMRIRTWILARLQSHKKLNVYMKNVPVLKVGNRSKRRVPTKIQKATLKDRKPGLFVNFGQFPCSWILIRIPNTDPDPGQPYQFGSMRIRIQNTGNNCPLLQLSVSNNKLVRMFQVSKLHYLKGNFHSLQHQPSAFN